jgi:hypothetical protein
MKIRNAIIVIKWEALWVAELSSRSLLGPESGKPYELNEHQMCMCNSLEGRAPTQGGTLKKFNGKVIPHLNKADWLAR